MFSIEAILTPVFRPTDYCVTDLNLIGKLAFLQDVFRHLTSEGGILTQFKTGTPDWKHYAYFLFRCVMLNRLDYRQQITVCGNNQGFIIQTIDGIAQYLQSYIYISLLLFVRFEILMALVTLNMFL